MIANLFALICLILMELALSIDNVIFVSLLVGKLPQSEQPRARQLWMIVGLVLRIALLVLLTYAVKALKTPLFTLHLESIGFVLAVTGRNLIFLAGGFFLLAKSVLEIHGKLEGGEQEHIHIRKGGFGRMMIQIWVIDLVFSIDSIVTAMGVAGDLRVMIPAVVVALIGMFFFAKPLGRFVYEHPTIQVLALSFLLLIGILLVAEGLGQEISKNYIYFAMAFSLGVELLNLRVTKDTKVVHLNQPEAETKK